MGGCCYVGSVLRWYQAQFYVGAGAIAPKPQLCPQMLHKTPFDELKVWAYRCRKKRCVAFKIQYTKNAFTAGAPHQTPLAAHDAPQIPSRLWREHPSPTHNTRCFSASILPHLASPLSAFGTSISGRHSPKIFFSRTARNVNCIKYKKINEFWCKFFYNSRS